MYINEDYNSYKYLVNAQNDFVTLTNKNHITVTSGDTKDLHVIYNYFNTGEIIEDTLSFSSSSSFTDISSNFSNDIFDLGFAPHYFICGSIIIFFIVFIVNNLTKLFKKGGIFGFN